jgi:hypothetical protein
MRQRQTPGRPRPTNCLIILSASALVLALATPVALAAPVKKAAPKPPLRVTVSSHSLVAHSAVRDLTFSFLATKRTITRVRVLIPGVGRGEPWTAPQSAHPRSAGYVVALKQTCKSASVASITRSAHGARTVVVRAKCAARERFALKYTKVRAPTKASTYTFVTKARVGRRFVALPYQPQVTVRPAPAATLKVSGLVDAVAGTRQAPTVTARDAYGNTATGYRGTVHFEGTGDTAPFHRDVGVFAGWNVPANYRFIAADAGVHRFAATAMWAGDQTLTAADTVRSTMVGAQTVAVSPGASALLTATPETTGTVLIGQMVRFALTFWAVDAFGNVATGDDSNACARFTANSSTTAVAAVLQNGTFTLHRNVALSHSTEQLTYEYWPCADFSAGSGGAVVYQAVDPRLDHVRLNITGTPNADGNVEGDLYIPTLDVHVDPSTIVTVGDVDVSFDLTPVPFSAKSIDGLDVGGIAMLTTPQDTTTGELKAEGIVIPSGSNFVVRGCEEAGPGLWAFTPVILPGTDITGSLVPCGHDTFYPVNVLTNQVANVTVNSGGLPTDPPGGTVMAMSDISKPLSCTAGTHMEWTTEPGGLVSNHCLPD